MRVLVNIRLRNCRADEFFSHFHALRGNEIILKSKGNKMFPTKQSSCGQFTVKCKGYAEPNNGRELWLVDVCYKNRNINKLLPRGNDGINFRVDQWVFECPNQEYLYIPTEGQASLIHMPSLNIYSLPFVGVSTHGFIGNSFSEGALTEIYRDNDVITPLLLKDLNQSLCHVNL